MPVGREIILEGTGLLQLGRSWRLVNLVSRGDRRGGPAIADTPRRVTVKTGQDWNVRFEQELGLFFLIEWLMDVFGFLLSLAVKLKLWKRHAWMIMSSSVSLILFSLDRRTDLLVNPKECRIGAQ